MALSNDGSAERTKVCGGGEATPDGTPNRRISLPTLQNSDALTGSRARARREWLRKRLTARPSTYRHVVMPELFDGAVFLRSMEPSRRADETA